MEEYLVCQPFTDRGLMMKGINLLKIKKAKVQIDGSIDEWVFVTVA